MPPCPRSASTVYRPKSSPGARIIRAAPYVRESSRTERRAFQSACCTPEHDARLDAPDCAPRCVDIGAEDGLIEGGFAGGEIEVERTRRSVQIDVLVSPKRGVGVED